MPKLTDAQREEITKAVYEGKEVNIVNGEVRIAPLASGPAHTGQDMSAYLESKFADLDNRIEHGWSFTIAPNGVVDGWTHDGSRLRSTPEGRLDARDVQLAHDSIRAGQAVTVQPDGSLVVSPRSPVDYRGVPTHNQVDNPELIIKMFDKDLASGELEIRARDGTTYSYGNPMADDTAPQPTEEAPAQPDTTPSADTRIAGDEAAQMPQDPSGLDDASAPAPADRGQAEVSASTQGPAGDLDDVGQAPAPSTGPQLVPSLTDAEPGAQPVSELVPEPESGAPMDTPPDTPPPAATDDFSTPPPEPAQDSAAGDDWEPPVGVTSGPDADASADVGSDDGG